MRKLEESVASAMSHISGTVVAGVSGGADSVALLLALCATGHTPLVVTCDFHLRGDESSRDRRFVAALCRRLGVECLEADMDVPGYIERHGGSVEMACRELRYDLFRHVMRDRGAVRIAVAHNSDDNAETLLLNLMRTSGIEGLRGMLPDTGTIIRPLLEVSRREIEQYLAEKGESYVIDSTNLEDDYRRNFIRNRVLPLLETRWPGARRAIAATQRNLRGEARVIDAAISAASAADVLSWGALTACGDPRTFIHRFTLQAGISASQVEEITRHSHHPVPGRRWCGDNGEVHSERDGLHLVLSTDSSPLPEFRWFCCKRTPELDTYMRSLRKPTAAFLADPPESFTWRPPRPGDRISTLGMRGTQAVSDVLKDAALTRRERESMLLLVDRHDRIVWIPGVKRSRLSLLTPQSTYVYIVTPETAIADHIIIRRFSTDL